MRKDEAKIGGTGVWGPPQRGEGGSAPLPPHEGKLKATIAIIRGNLTISNTHVLSTL